MTTLSDPAVTYRQHPNLVAAPMDGDLVMMSIERGTYYGIHGVGGRVWELLAQPQTLLQLTQAICGEFEVDPQTCSQDLQVFLEDLSEHGLIVSN